MTSSDNIPVGSLPLEHHVLSPWASAATDREMVLASADVILHNNLPQSVTPAASWVLIPGTQPFRLSIVFKIAGQEHPDRRRPAEDEKQ